MNKSKSLLNILEDDSMKGAIHTWGKKVFILKSKFFSLEDFDINKRSTLSDGTLYIAVQIPIKITEDEDNTYVEFSLDYSREKDDNGKIIISYGIPKNGIKVLDTNSNIVKLDSNKTNIIYNYLYKYFLHNIDIDLFVNGCLDNYFKESNI